MSLPHLTLISRSGDSFAGLSDDGFLQTMNDLTEQFYKVELNAHMNHATIIKRNRKGKPVYGLMLVRDDKINQIFEEMTYLFNFIFNILDLPMSRTNSYFQSIILCHLVRRFGKPIGKKRLMDHWYDKVPIDERVDIPMPKKSINKGKHNRFYKGR